MSLQKEQDPGAHPSWGGWGGLEERKKRNNFKLQKNSVNLSWRSPVIASHTQIQFMTNHGCYQSINLLGGTATLCERSGVKMNVANLWLMHYQARRPGVGGGEEGTGGEETVCSVAKLLQQAIQPDRNTFTSLNLWALCAEMKNKTKKQNNKHFHHGFVFNVVRREITWKFNHCRPDWLRCTWIAMPGRWWAGLLMRGVSRYMLRRLGWAVYPPPARAPDVPASSTGSREGLHLGPM